MKQPLLICEAVTYPVPEWGGQDQKHPLRGTDPPAFCERDPRQLYPSTYGSRPDCVVPGAGRCPQAVPSTGWSPRCRNTGIRPDTDR